MIKTFKELKELDSIVGSMYSKEPTLKDTKFGYHYKRICEKFYIPVVNEYNNAINDARLDFAMEIESTKEVLMDTQSVRGYKYTKEGLKNIIKKERELQEEWNKKEIEVEPFISSHVPENLSEEEKEALTGILI